MPINIPKSLPAAAILARENVFVMHKKRAEHQDIREIKILILNLMPTKIETETQLLRLLSNSPLQVEIELLKLESYIPKNTPEEHLLKFYKTFNDICEKKFDGMIITGAPVEHMEFEEVAYWEELTQIMDWALANITSTFYICWSAQAALYHQYGIKKYLCKGNKKLSGIYKNHINNKLSDLLRGFDDYFYVPQSRYTQIRKEDIEQIKELEILSESKDAGVYIIATKDLKQVFVTGHSEYDPFTLKKEYERDCVKDPNTSIPINYFKNNTPSNGPIVNWRSHANLLFSNWLNYAVYQITNYNLGEESINRNPKFLNIALFGIGNVGSTFIKQLLENKYKILKDENIYLNIFAISNSKNIYLNISGIQENWKENVLNSNEISKLSTLFNFVKGKKLTNLIFIDTTSSDKLILSYKKIIQNGFNIIAANKKANASSFQFYEDIRKTLIKENRHFLYETNVGAGLPVVGTIKYLYQSGDKIKKIRGVFSGSLSFLFNNFSVSNECFSKVLKKAIKQGLTEPDIRDDLSGMDVARKLLILSREIGFRVELDEVYVTSLIPEEMEGLSLKEFWQEIQLIDTYYENIKKDQKIGHVLRYIGEFNEKNLSVKLISVPNTTPIGKLSESDTIFEIYTERYNSTPLIIQGAGAGKEVTASGVFSDVLKIGNRIIHNNSITE